MYNLNDTVGEKLAQAFDQLPPGKKEFLLGYAEGVAAMAGKEPETPAGANPQSLRDSSFAKGA